MCVAHVTSGTLNCRFSSRSLMQDLAAIPARRQMSGNGPTTSSSAPPSAAANYRPAALACSVPTSLCTNPAGRSWWRTADGPEAGRSSQASRRHGGCPPHGRSPQLAPGRKLPEPRSSRSRPCSASHPVAHQNQASATWCQGQDSPVPAKSSPVCGRPNGDRHRS